MTSGVLNLSENQNVSDDLTIRLLREQIMDKAERKTERIRDLFLEFDMNHDGVVSYDEFRTGLQRLGVHAPPEQVDKLIKIADQDNSGAIDYSEFVDIMRFDKM